MKYIRKFLYLLFAASLISCASSENKKTSNESSSLSSEKISAIAEEAYIYAYPMLDNYKAMYFYAIWEESPAYVAPVNQLYNTAELRTPKDKEVVRPNNDTYYSNVIMDLRREPLVLSVPAIEDKRYYAFQLIDLYTHNFDYVGSRETGFEAGNYMIAGPNWDGEKPEDINKVIRTETNLALALCRTQVYGPNDAENAKAIMAGYAIQPLSSFLGGEEAPAEPNTIQFPLFSPEKAKSAEFISYLNFFLELVQPYEYEKELLARFSKIGIAPGATFEIDSLDDNTRMAIENGIESAMQKIEAEMAKLGERKNGWMLISGAFGKPSEMQGKYLTRAAAAMFGIYGNSLEEAFYPETTFDSDGEELDGSKHSYLLHFEADELPPVNAFWSFTMYNLPEQLLIENEINRYVVNNNLEGLQYNEDGSLDIYIQKDNPGAEKVSNWLPAHDGKFSLQARFYWPKKEALNPLYAPPAVEKVN